MLWGQFAIFGGLFLPSLSGQRQVEDSELMLKPLLAISIQSLCSTFLISTVHLSLANLCLKLPF